MKIFRMKFKFEQRYTSNALWECFDMTRQTARKKVIFDVAVETEQTLALVSTATQLERTPTLWQSTRCV